MLTLKEGRRLFLIVALLVVVGGSAAAAPPSKARRVFLWAYSQEPGSAAVISGQENSPANARATMIASLSDAWRRPFGGRSAWLKAVAKAQAEAAHAGGQQDSKNASGATPTDGTQEGPAEEEGPVVLLIPFTERSNLRGARQGSAVPKQPGAEDLAGYYQALGIQQPTGSPSDPAKDKIRWPKVLMGAEFSGWRIQIECLLAQRQAVSGIPAEGLASQMRMLAGQMRAQLRWKVGQVPPEEYLAAQTFLGSLTYSVWSPAGVRGATRK